MRQLDRGRSAFHNLAFVYSQVSQSSGGGKSFFTREANVSRFLFYDEDDEMVLLGDWRVMDKVDTAIRTKQK